MTTLTKYELAKRMRETIAYLDVNLEEAEEIIEVIGETIIRHFQEGGDKVVLRGFGTFKIRNRKAYETRHPISGEDMMVSAMRSIAFKPAAETKRRLNN